MQLPLDLFTGPLRSLLGVAEEAERDAEQTLGQTRELERQLDDAVGAIHRAAESMERLAEYCFEWVLPGHGQRVHLPAAQMRQQIERLTGNMRERSKV